MACCTTTWSDNTSARQPRRTAIVKLRGSLPLAVAACPEHTVTAPSSMQPFLVWSVMPNSPAWAR